MAERKVHHVSTLLFAIFLGACGSEEPAPVTPEVVLARDRAADFGARAQWREACDVLAPLVSRPNAPLEDLLRAANAQLAVKDADDRVELATALVERAEALAPDDPIVLWCRYRLRIIAFETRAALEVLRRIHARLPDDYTVSLALASCLDDLDEPDTEKEAQERYWALLEVPPEHSGSWRRTVLYKLPQSLIRQGLSEEAAEPMAEAKRLAESGLTSPGIPSHEPDTLGAIPPHTPGILGLPTPEPPVAKFRTEERGADGSLVGARVVELSLRVGRDLGAEHGASREELYALDPEPALLGFGPGGITLVSKTLATRSIHAGPVQDLAPFDRMNVGAFKSTDVEKKEGDRDLDLLLMVEANGGSDLHLLENVAGQWTLRSEPLARFSTFDGPGHMLDVDFDHDGDVDLLVTTPSGPRLLRNDGLDGTGGFTDATQEAGMPSGDFVAVSEDLDRDNDVDFLWVDKASGAVRLSSNERGGRFSDASASLPPGLKARWLVPADFDGDGWVDLAVFGTDLALYTRTANGGWRSEPERFALEPAPLGAPRVADWDLDGSLDLLWPCAGALAGGLLGPGLSSGGVPIRLGDGSAAPVEPVSLEVADLDGDLDLDLVRIDSGKMRIHLNEGGQRGIRIAFRGHKDYARGLGTILELRAGLFYQRRYTRGGAELVGFGGRKLDVIRETWPNGVVQSNFDFAPGQSILIEQRLGQVGSCPFLYTWNGTTYEFISDVLGITPLGLPMAPGMPGSPPMLVPPDHDEYVLVKGEQLVPKDGVFEMRFTEELREVTYLDRIRLDVIDHPADTEIFPNERFSFPPFPEAHTHTLKAPLLPKCAVDQNGKDWAEALARDDRVFAIPFVPLKGQYRGLAEPYTLEVAFDPERVVDAPKLRLFLNGWFYWTDASVNVAVARHPDHAFVPPILSVPDGEGGWTELGPIGFPAGKLKTMALDVDSLLNRADPRIRLSSTLRLYWDSIRLAVDADDAPLVSTSLEPLSADLWERGFSRSFPLLDEHDCEWFEWDALEPQPRWNQHPGFYTRLGDTRELLGAIDDRFVIMGAGDALTLRFDASGLPPLADGWRRDYLVFLDGWAKDRDPNTLEALFVEPLPFHGMSGYPYRDDEHYPDDEAHRAYRREWNTRPAKRWIEPLAPWPGRSSSSSPASGVRTSTTSTIPTKSETPATRTEPVKLSPRSHTPAAPATSG